MPAGRGGRRPRVQLDIEQIVDAAMDIADRKGPDAMTMRAIAAELGVGVMSLYWYVPNKRELEGLVLERLMRESAPPPDSTGNWRANLELIARNNRKGMLAHPWMVDLFSSSEFIPEHILGHGMLSHMENTMRMVEDLPLSFEEKMSIMNMIDDFTLGFAFGEVMERRRLEALGMTEDELHTSIAPRIQALLDEADYPLFRHFMAHDHELPNKDQQFEHALQIMLDGVEVQIERATAKREN
ncbi:MAG TPA: TetR/AcrR family transcriptional regulator [Thermomicrobiales bacterium]|nr:TetR/AcrR family transcriptional regulator [Thermomicrobiales bacterium]